MIAGLHGNDSSLNARQEPLGLRQRQLEVRDVAQITGSAKLHQLDATRPAIRTRFDQLQHQAHR